MVAEAALDHPVAELDGGVEIIRIVEAIEQKVRPKLERGQIVPRKTIDMGGRTEHGFLPR